MSASHQRNRLYVPLFLVNYIDDLCGVAHKTDAYNCYNFLSTLMTELGVRESTEKSVAPVVEVDFLGVLFNSEIQTMSVTPSRLVEIEDILNRWLSFKSASKKDLQSLIGKLQFIA